MMLVPLPLSGSVENPAAAYWPSRVKFTCVAPCVTVNVPWVLLAFSAKPAVVLVGSKVVRSRKSPPARFQDQRRDAAAVADRDACRLRQVADLVPRRRPVHRQAGHRRR